LVKIQAGLDWLAVILLVHFSGGVESPLLFFFVFHLIIASILLSRRACYALATLAALAVTSLGLLEYLGILRHHSLWLTSGSLYQNGLFMAAVLLFLTTTLYLTVYLTTTITQSLRDKDEQLIRAQLALSEAYAALEEADRAKSEFVRMASHELRSPLSAVQSMLRIMDQGIVGPLSEKQRDLIGRTLRRVNMLLALVGDLLELAAGRMELLKKEPVQADLGELVDKVTELMVTRAGERELDVQVEIGDRPLTLTGVEEDLERVVMNLVSNAVKYTPAGGTVSVRAGLEEAGITLQVSDTGIGIPEDALPRIFSEFYRARNAKALDVEGTGLGLVITRELVEQHGGSISVESSLGQGSTFTVQFPRTG
jgi:signal transduction histidine kinase